MESLYVPDGAEFASTELTRGPWSPNHQHGGPPAALMARAMERHLAAEVGDAPFAPVRMSVELLRPVPIGRLRVDAETVRSGNKVRGVAATLRAGGDSVARATAVFIRRSDVAVTVNQPGGAPRTVADSQPYSFTFFRAEVGYHTAMEGRVADGVWGSGRMTLWMRLRVPLVPGEAPSPLQRVIVAADSGNGISAALDPMQFTFVNPDLTVYLHRPPEGEWVCLAATTVTSPGGIGLAECALADERGPIGRSLQSLLIAPR